MHVIKCFYFLGVTYGSVELLGDNNFHNFFLFFLILNYLFVFLFYFYIVPLFFHKKQ